VQRTVLSNQVYQEAYTCPSLKVHPDGAHFVAQSNAGYIAIFSSQPPYKLNKFKVRTLLFSLFLSGLCAHFHLTFALTSEQRFEGHQVEGYRVGCDISPDGSLVATGSANGYIHFYSWYSGKEIKTISTIGATDHRAAPSSSPSPSGLSAASAPPGGGGRWAEACTHVAFHPLHPQVMAACGWDGSVLLLGGGEA
jgi:WD40 repeat protein